MKRTSVWMGVCVVASAAAFFAGRGTAPAAHAPARDGDGDSAASATRSRAAWRAAGRAGSDSRANAVTTGGGDAPANPSAERGGAAGADCAACASEVAACRERATAEAKQRAFVEGTPVAMPAELPPRFSQDALTSTLARAFKQSKVPGRVETIDCGEYPCILYGRILGDENNLERIERAKAFANYDADILTLLSWGATDEHGAKPADEGQPERLLFAIALYSRQDKARLGDNLDRRIRVRTADLWNALRPDDEE